MSGETKSLKQPMSLVQKSRSYANDIAEYLRITMADYPARSLFRIAVYLLEGALVGLFFYLWLEYTPTETIFKTFYPIFVGFTIIFWHYMITEIGGRFFYKRSKSLRLTSGKFWVISFIGVCFGYLMVYFNGQCPGIAEFYPDISSFYSGHSSPTLVRLAVFYKIVLIPWAVCTFLLIQGEQKKQIAGELASIKEINDSLDQKKSVISIKDSELNDKVDSSKYEHTSPLHRFSILSGDGIKTIDVIDIYFIAVEDHYCKIVFNSNGKICKEYSRLSLKEALAKLPSSHFAQVHRSYAVNLQHVKHIKKEGQAYQLLIAGSDNFLPASRHRAHAFLPKLKQFLN